MTVDDWNFDRVFTLDEANAHLPLIRAIVSDIVSNSRDLASRRERLTELRSSRSGQTTSVYSEEVSQVEDQLEMDTRRLEGYLRELRELGVQLRGATEGLIEFPTVLDGCVAFFCWKPGDTEVLYWRDAESDFSQRQLVTAMSASDEACQ